MDLRTLVERYARTADPQYFAADASFRDIARDEGFAGQAAIGAMLRSFLYEAFSDIEIAVRTVVVDADGGRAAVEWTFRGRHTGELWGIPLTGRRVELAMLGVYEIEDGLIRSARLYYDTATLLRQLGHSPERAQRGASVPLRAGLAARARRAVASLKDKAARIRRSLRAAARGVRVQRRTWRWRRPRQLRRVAVAALIGTIVVAILIGQAVLAPAPAAAAEATLTILDGDVGVSRGDGGFVTAADGQAVRSGDTVRTGDSAHAVLTYFDGSTATIEPLSEVVVEGISVARSGELVVSIRQTIGHTWHVITNRPSGSSNYQVHTPTATAVVRGTAFEVKVKPKAGSPQEVVTEVATTDGVVGVTSPAAPEIEVKVPEGTKTDVDPQARPKEPEAIPEPEVKVKVTLDAVPPAFLPPGQIGTAPPTAPGVFCDARGQPPGCIPNAVVVQQNGLAVGVQQGRAVRYAPGSKVTVENGKLVIEIPNAQAGRLSSIVHGASTDTRSLRIETEISTGNVVVAKTVEDRPLERSDDPARSGTVAKGGIILTPVGVVVLPDAEAKRAVDANIGKAPAAPATVSPAFLPPGQIGTAPPTAPGVFCDPRGQPPGCIPSSAPATPFAGTFQAFVLTGIPSGTPTGSPIPGTTAPGPGPTTISLDALPPQVLSVLFASNPGHKARPAEAIETAAPATVPPVFVPPGQIGTAPPTAPGVFCDARGQPPGCIPFAAGPTPVPPQGAPVFCDQRGQPPGCIPPHTTAFLPGGIFAAGGVFGVGGFFDPTARRGPEAPGAPAPPRALFTPPPTLVLDGTCGLAGYRSCFASETPRPGLVPFGTVAPAQAPCGVPGDPRCFSSTPIQGITCDFAGGPTCPSNALPPGSTAPPGAIPGLDGNCGLPGLRGCFAGETPRPGLVGPPIAAPGTFPGITGPTRGVTCDGPGLPTCPPNAVDPPPGFVPGRPFLAGPGFGQFDGTCGLPGLRPCFPGETPRPGLQPQPGFAPGFVPVSGPTRGITCDGPGLPTCPPNAVDAPPGFRPGQPFPGGPGVAPTPPAAGIPFDAVCGQAGFRACAPGETPQHVIGVTCGTANLPACPAEAKPGVGPGFVAPVAGPGPQLGPGQVACDDRGQPPGCVRQPTPAGLQPGQVFCDDRGQPPGCVPPAQRPPLLPPGQVYCDQFGRPPGCIPQPTGAQPGFAPGAVPVSGPTRGITCDGPGLPTCPPNAVDPPPGFRPGQPFPGGPGVAPTQPAAGIPFDAVCGRPGFRACAPGETPQHVIGVTCGTANLPPCPAEAKPGVGPGFVAPVAGPGPQLGPGQVYCDNRGQPPGCVVAPGGVPPAQGVPVPGPGQPTGDGTCGLPGYRPCSAGETPRPGLPQQPGFAPGAVPVSGPTRGVTCDGPGLPACPPNAVNPPPGFQPGQGPTPGATCGGPGLPACPGQQPFQPGQQPPGGFQPGQQPPFGPQPPFQPGQQPPYLPGTQPFQPAQPPGGFAPAQPPPGGVAPPPGFVPQPAPVLPYCDGVIITTNCRPPGG